MSSLSMLSTARANLAAATQDRVGLVQISAAAGLWGTTGVAVQLIPLAAAAGGVLLLGAVATLYLQPRPAGATP